MFSNFGFSPKFAGIMLDWALCYTALYFCDESRLRVPNRWPSPVLLLFFAGFLLQNEQSSSCPESSIFARWFIDGPKKSPLSGMLFWKRAVVRDTVYFCDEKPASGAESLAFARSLIAFLRDFHFQVKTLCLSQSDIAFPFEAPDFSRFPTGRMDFFPSEATEISAGRHGILRTGFLCPGDDGLHAPG